MTLPYIAEFHDIAKLLDEDALKHIGILVSRQTFENFDFFSLGIKEPSSPSWYSRLCENTSGLNSTTTQNNVFEVVLTKIADTIASCISRPSQLKNKGTTSAGIHCLWNPNTSVPSRTIAKKEQLIDLFSFVDNCQSRTEFFKKYESELYSIPEDISAPLNITSLYIHLELVGKIYNVLRENTSYLPKKTMTYDKQSVPDSTQAMGGRVNEPSKKGKWTYRFIECAIQFSQRFARLQDLNILSKRSQKIREFAIDTKTSDYVMFYTDEMLFLFLPNENVHKIQDVLNNAFQGFIVEYKELEAELGLLVSDMDNQYDKFHSQQQNNRHLKLRHKIQNLINIPNEVQIPLCEVCQLNQGTRFDKEEITEYLCASCKTIRESGNPFSDYPQWSDMGIKAGWAKISLDAKLMAESIKELFENYVDTSPLMQNISETEKNNWKNAFRPLAVEVEFVKDYKKFLSFIRSNLVQATPDIPVVRFPIIEYDEFFIFQVKNGKDILNVIDVFISSIEKFFPACKTNSPIQLAISVATIQYPSRQHWHYLTKKKQSAIRILTQGAGSLELKLPEYEQLKKNLAESKENSSFLHNLVSIEKETESELFILEKLFSSKKDNPKVYSLFKQGISIENILNFYKLTMGILEEAVHAG